MVTIVLYTVQRTMPSSAKKLKFCIAVKLHVHVHVAKCIVNTVDRPKTSTEIVTAQLHAVLRTVINV